MRNVKTGRRQEQRTKLVAFDDVVTPFDVHDLSFERRWREGRVQSAVLKRAAKGNVREMTSEVLGHGFICVRSFAA